MSIAWLAPAAFAGLALIALPIAVHLLVRQHGRVLPYPSLRFLGETQLAAFRRRMLQDMALLACRAAIIAIAALALAGPVVETSPRRATYASRISRAIVAIDADQATIARASAGAFAASTFARPVLSDAIGDAARWLDGQPPSSREVVIAGDLRSGAIDQSDIDAIPKDVGIRFLASPASGVSGANLTVPVLIRRDGILVREDWAVFADTSSTRATPVAGKPVPPDLVTVAAAPADTALAEASLRAALDAGIPWADFNRHVIVVWDGAVEPQDLETFRLRQGYGGQARPEELPIVRMAVPSPPAVAADEVRRALSRASTLELKNPYPVPAEQLAAWRRPPGPPAANTPLSDEGDRRWLWGLAILLMIAEWWMRRSAKSALPERIEDSRVA
jgi:hypothetical protein